MTTEHPVLALLRADPTGGRWGLALPPGRLVAPDPDLCPAWPGPAYWLSDTAPDPDLLGRVEVAGLWPLLLAGDSHDPEQPWAAGQVDPAGASDPASFDPAVLLAGWWAEAAGHDEEHDHLDRGQRLAVTAPHGADWPGLAPVGTFVEAPAAIAGEYARHLLGGEGRELPGVRLGLAPATRAADAIAAVGWLGTVNHDGDAAKYSAVLRGWEDRFGARVVAVGADTLHLAVAAPPATPEEALWVAAEHFAFCPDNVWQGPENLRDYAAGIVGARNWDFWWD